MTTILITGGARSGKSQMAQELAGRAKGKVLFIATAFAGDEEMRERIAEHKKSRPNGWRTLEVTENVGTRIRENIGGAKTVVIDCITLLVSNVFGRYADKDGEISDAASAERAAVSEITQLLDCITYTPADFIIVTNEVGLGLVPDNKLGRLYRDVLGKANRLLAEEVDEVYLMVAGLPLKLKPSGNG
ncbi:MAG: bifunctional adenosylcobinamide kinase/adenosylcobinamide-phosphate guanylyltransferase [Dehalococcoidales bacterium]|nr:bifunctional adenosylcobinamide kinase/adenosylcobinamide-phosphate guanylyltransferase [Dehalococcoidales bacterium]